MAALSSNINIRWETRVCTVDGETGYFHTWEQYSKPGGLSKVYGIVEFERGVRRVDPAHIQFCDEDHAALCALNKFEKEKNDEG